MVEINDFHEERCCTYKDEEYLVRDNGSVLRKSRPNQRVRKMDDEWTFGKLNNKTGYLEIATVRVHRIVAVAFHGEPPTNGHIVDHIDTNRQNNRPSNLRWITRLENAVLNDVTRKRIEYRIGVDIYEFLENPSKYRDMITDSDFSWMRRVTDDEAKACLENLQRLSENGYGDKRYNSKMGEWIYKSHSNHHDPAVESSKISQPLLSNPLARHKNWNSSPSFNCCPSKLEENPLQRYCDNMSIGAMFSIDKYGNRSTVHKFALVDDKIIVITNLMDSSVKHYGMVEITFKFGYYMHESIRTFFTEESAEKHFTLAQGLEWIGGDNIDDYC